MAQETNGVPGADGARALVRGGEEPEPSGGGGALSRGRRIADSIQDYVAVGYLYLLVLGIASDSLFYGALGINIIRYSTVLDVLLSPVVHLTDQVAFPLVIFGIPLVGLAITRVFVRKGGGEVPLQIGGRVRARLGPMTFWAGFSGMVIFSAYLGLGLGGGQALKSALDQGRLSMDHRLTFQDGSAVDVRMVGNNSTYAFYVVEGSRVVSVSPIHENIRSIEVLSPEP